MLESSQSTAQGVTARGRAVIGTAKGDLCIFRISSAAGPRHIVDACGDMRAENWLLCHAQASRPLL